jgi:hypothetical protein
MSKYSSHILNLTSLNIPGNAYLYSEIDIISNIRPVMRSYSSDIYSTHLSLGLESLYKVGIKYPNSTVWSNNNSDEECIICYTRFIENDIVYKLDCSTRDCVHIFHKSCLEKWNKDYCPYCRTTIVNKNGL